MSDILSAMNKLRLLGRVDELPVHKGSAAYIGRASDDNYILYIPDDVKYLNMPGGFGIFTNKLIDYTGSIKVYGGKNLKSTYGMFTYCNFKEIDLSEFETDNVESMANMFQNNGGGIRVKIIFGNMKTHNVTDMSHMFENVVVSDEGLDINNFDTSNVTNMESMFQDFVGNIKLDKISTCKLENMKEMFKGAALLDGLDLRSFDTTNVKNMDEMFEFITATIGVNVSNLKTANVASAKRMFSGAEITFVEATNLSFRSNAVAGMFSGSRIASLNLEGLSIASYDAVYKMFEMTVLHEINAPNYVCSIYKSVLEQTKHELRERRQPYYGYSSYDEILTHLESQLNDAKLKGYIS